MGIFYLPRLQDANIIDQEFQNALSFAVARHNSGIKTYPSLRHVVNIVSAQVQVVEGLKYVIVVTLGRTNCEKGQPNMGCTVYTDPAQAQIYQCTFTGSMI
ncbi:hypothetical protein ILYODFUR_021098 [Ilyodon furcidens]|uniref:Cystatin domain-containing protein n=1 Tax=Ilyodon furcidens TaxID=33524 RepID=A0ABV0SN30_9TELE